MVRASHLFRVEDPRTLGLFRIAIGLFVVGDIASLWPHAEYLYSPNGGLPAETVCNVGWRGLSVMCQAPSYGVAVATLVVLMTCALLFSVGAATRVTGWLTAYGLLSVVLRNHLPLAGEQVFGNFLFLLCLSRCGAAYSVDNWLRCRGLRQAGRLNDLHPEHATYRPIPAWPRLMMIGQLCLMFGVAGWAKTGETYADGTALYYLMANERWMRWELWGLLSVFGTNLLKAATWGGLAFERLFPLVAVGLVGRTLFAALPRWFCWLTSRWIWVPAAATFAGILLLFANLGWFVLGTLVAPLVLYRGSEVAPALDRLVRRAHRTCPVDAAARSPPWKRALVSLFVAWHGLAMVINAIDLPQFELEIPDTIRRPTDTWARITNTWQFWGMFSPDAPKSRARLRIDVELRDGTTTPGIDDRTLIAQRGAVYIFIDRRHKVFAKIRRYRRGYPRLHAEWVCRTFVSADGERPAAVRIGVSRWPLPRPQWQASYGPDDPRPASEPFRIDQQLGHFPCRD